jgi:hypothetical protein
MATFSTPFQALPHPKTTPILDPLGRPVPIDIYDLAQWQKRRWGVFSPEVTARVSASMPTPAAGEQAVADMQARFGRNLRRAARMEAALSAPFPMRKVEVAVFGGDCETTPGHAILLDGPDGGRLAFRASQVADRGSERGGYERLMFEPGDGLVTRSSQTGRPPLGVEPGAEGFNLLPVRQSFFLCESHGRLTHNPYFQDNLLYFLLSR